MIGRKKSDRTGRVERGEGLGHDADHREVVAIEQNSAADDLRIRRELLRPHRVTENDDGIARRHLIFVGAERSSDDRIDVNDVEKVAAGEHPELELRRCGSFRSEADREVLVRDETFEAVAVIADVHVIRIRGTDRTGAECFNRRGPPDREYLARAWDGQRPQHQRVGKAEDGAVGADADGERQDRDSREAGIRG